jgi:nucleoside-diphosphate-sugar epimerase
MKIVITGGSGFIGQNLLIYFIKNNYNVLNLDIRQPSNLNYLKYWVKIDINNFIELENILNTFKPDFILHFAARTDLSGLNINDYKVNFIGTENVIKISIKINSIKKIIFSSSMLVCKLGYIPKHYTDFSPTTAYGKSKVLMEEIIRKYDNLSHIIVRPTSIWGPGFKTPYYDFFIIILKGRYFDFGLINTFKTYGYIENFIFQINYLLHIDLSKIDSNTFYLGDYDPINISDWSHEIAKEAGVKIKKAPFIFISIAAIFGDFLKILNINFPITSFRLNNMSTNNIIDLNPIKNLVPVLPYTRIEGVRKTLNWIKNKHN